MTIGTQKSNVQNEYMPSHFKEEDHTDSMYPLMKITICILGFVCLLARDLAHESHSALMF